MDRRLLMAFMCVLIVGTALPVCAAGDRSAMPLAVGNRWEYAVFEIGVVSVGEGASSRSVLTQSRGTCVEEVVSLKERRPNGDLVYEHRSFTQIEAGLNTDPSELTVESRVLASKDGIAILASKASGLDDVFTDQWVEYDPPLVIFGAGLSPGEKWEIGTVTEGDLHMPMQAQVVGRETVTVPAGTFRDCLKIHVTCSRITGTMGSGEDEAAITEGKSVDTVWVYPGVGVVKEVDIFQAKMRMSGGESGVPLIMTGTQRQTKQLQAYTVD